MMACGRFWLPMEMATKKTPLILETKCVVGDDLEG